eukprot:gb/GECG01015270.1/.p1 GENE.gb/GECG01015270.1/~~gb/GECG01015270.1/.p1  ORF type:complete len:433 (+),score=41.76 gb/GECG01015270.1/:1-1299(+)
MYIAVEGCAHGALDDIYASVQELERTNGVKVDLLICCGDFQSTRDEYDLQHMACPPKFRQMNSFPAYFNGEKVAPVLTIFVGGNHEAVNYLYDLYYGGWVAPNMYFLGHSGSIRVGGLRISGISGIYKDYDFGKPLFERFPLTEKHRRTVYHTRSWECYKLAQLPALGSPVDIMISHDWPTIATSSTDADGDIEQLIRHKQHFGDEIRAQMLGNPMTSRLLKWLRPAFWFSGHMHTKFSSVIRHSGEVSEAPFTDNLPAGKWSATRYEQTRFLALDKCLPGKRFLQLLDIKSPQASSDNSPVRLEFDFEWLTILRKTTHQMPTVDNADTMSFEAVRLSTEDVEETRKLIHSWKEEIGEERSDDIPTCTFESGDPVHNYMILNFYDKLGLHLPGRPHSTSTSSGSAGSKHMDTVSVQASSAADDSAALDIDDI